MTLVLQDLFIGSEGTLGVITRVMLSLCPKPQSVYVSLMRLDGVEKAAQLLARARKELVESLSAFEIIDAASLIAVLSRHQTPSQLHEQLLGENVSDEGDITSRGVYVLLESCGTQEEELLDFMSACYEDEIIKDSIVSQTESQALALWQIREMVHTLLKLHRAMCPSPPPFFCDDDNPKIK